VVTPADRIDIISKVMFHCRMVQFVVMVPPKEVHSMLTKFMMNTKGWYHHVSHGMKWLTRSRKVANAKTRKRRHQEEQADKNNKTMMIVVTTSLPEPIFPPSCGYFLVPGRMCSAPKQAYCWFPPCPEQNVFCSISVAVRLAERWGWHHVSRM